MHKPTADPRIPASASGVSTQRSAPKRSRRPAVARKTPPARPTSSPMTITLSSRSSSTWNPSLMASTMESSAKPALADVGRRQDECVLEQKLRVGGRLGLSRRDRLTHEVGSLGPNRLGHAVGQQPGAPQVALVAAQTLALLLLLDPVEIDVGARVVGRRMRGGA